MSGRFLRPERNYATFARGWLSGRGRDAERARLQAALAVSFLLHALVLILPTLGERQPEFRVAIKGVQRGSYVLNATLALKGEHQFSGIPVPAEGESVPESSTTGRKGVEPPPPEDPGASGSGLLPVPGFAYYTTDQLTKRPQPLARAELDPPELAPILGSGKIVLRLWIDDRGKAAKVEVISSSLPGTFTRATVAGFEKLRFTPGERDGRAVGTVITIEVNYDDARKPPE